MMRSLLTARILTLSFTAWHFQDRAHLKQLLQVYLQVVSDISRAHINRWECAPCTSQILNGLILKTRLPNLESGRLLLFSLLLRHISFFLSLFINYF